MIGIGIRVLSNREIFYSVINEEEENYTYMTISKIVIPLAMDKPERLNYVRNAIVDIIDEYEIDCALVRVRERLNNITNLVVERFYIEGVLLESIAGSSVSKYALGKISSISKLLNIDRKEFKPLSEGNEEFDMIPDELVWGEFSKEERETILSCHAALNL